jgi:hypothetical protein
VLAADEDVVGGQLQDSGGGQAEQQDQHGGDAGRKRQGRVGQAEAEFLPALVLGQDVGRRAVGRCGHGVFAGEPALVCRGEEDADVVAAGRAGGQPGVDVGLAEAGEVEPALVEPVQEVEHEQHVSAKVPSGGGARAAACGAAAGFAEQDPVGERADQPGVAGRTVGEGAVQPDGDAVEVVVTAGQDAGCDEQAADVAFGVTLG